MSKTKTFITNILFQGKNAPDKKTYKGHGNSRLDYSKAYFPIIPAINGYTENGEKIRVIVIKTLGGNAEHNIENFLRPDIERIVEQKGLVWSGIETINTIDSEDIDTQLKLFSDIVDAINGGEDGEEISACITFGTKPTSIVLNMALSYAYRLKENVSIGCIVYGRYDPTDLESEKNGAYDTTALFYMNEIVNKLAEMKAPNPKRAIRAMLGLDDETEVSEDDE